MMALGCRGGIAHRINNNGETAMSLLGWIILGLVSGFIASKVVNKSGEGVLLDIILGVIGAVVGGWLFTTFGMAGVTGFNLYSMLVAIVGAIVVLVIYHAVTRKRI
jgi:uncharacterized membrane protein YeaQ/YmgE (transglycosylase-associated protein family)